MKKFLVLALLALLAGKVASWKVELDAARVEPQPAVQAYQMSQCAWDFVRFGAGWAVLRSQRPYPDEQGRLRYLLKEVSLDQTAPGLAAWEGLEPQDQVILVRVRSTSNDLAGHLRPVKYAPEI